MNHPYQMTRFKHLFEQSIPPSYLRQIRPAFFAFTLRLRSWPTAYGVWEVSTPPSDRSVWFLELFIFIAHSAVFNFHSICLLLSSSLFVCLGLIWAQSTLLTQLVSMDWSEKSTRNRAVFFFCNDSCCNAVYGRRYNLNRKAIFIEHV